MARRTDTRDPRAARLAALRVLHEADVRGEDPLVALERRVAAETPVERLRAAGGTEDPDLGDIRVDGFARSLVEGVAATRDDLDARIGRHARGWKIGRMPVVDRNLLRLAIHELMTEPTPVPVVLDEAVRLAKELSTDDSGRYVNGVLVAVAKELARPVDADAASSTDDAHGPGAPGEVSDR